MRDIHGGGKDWSDKRGEVLQAFAQAGLVPAAASSASILTADIESSYQDG